jgi:bacteriorhodopsin
MAGDIWLWIGFWGMALGFAAIAVLGRGRGDELGDSYVVHSLVPATAAVFYLLMALHQGAVPLENGSRLFYFGRYIDWSITTPLLLIGLSFTALGTLRGSAALVAAAVGADIMMIVTGFFAGISPTGSTAKWLWYFISCGAFVGVYYVLWGPMLRLAKARSAQVGKIYTRNAAILSVLWLAYPVVFVLGSEGLNIAAPALVLAAFTILDLLAKVAYGLLATAEHKRGAV